MNELTKFTSAEVREGVVDFWSVIKEPATKLLLTYAMQVILAPIFIDQGPAIVSS